MGLFSGGPLANAKKQARPAAKSKGHMLGPWGRFCPTDDLAFAKCLRCGDDATAEANGETGGLATRFPCRGRR